MKTRRRILSIVLTIAILLLLVLDIPVTAFQQLWMDSKKKLAVLRK